MMIILTSNVQRSCFDLVRIERTKQIIHISYNHLNTVVKGIIYF